MINYILAFILSINIILTYNIYGQVDSKSDNNKPSTSKAKDTSTVPTDDFSDAIKEGFSIENCIKYALNNNLNVQLEYLNKSLGEIGVREAKDNFLPKINGRLGYGYNFGRAIDPTSNQFINTSTSFSSAGVSLGVSLFEGFRLKRQMEKSKLSLASLDHKYSNRKYNIALQVAELFIAVVLSQELEKNALLKVENDKSNLEKSILLVAGGTQPKSTEINARSTLLLSQSQLTTAKNTVLLNVLQLKHLMRLNEEDELKLKLPKIDEISPPPYTVAFMYESALKNQGDVLSSKVEEEIANKNEDIAKSGYYPSLSLNGSIGTSYSGQRNTTRNIFGDAKTTTQQIGVVENTNNAVVTQITRPEVIGTDPDYTFLEQYTDNFNQALSLNLSIPIFNNRRTSNNIQRARILKRQATLNTQIIEQQLRQNIERAYQAALAALDNYNSADANLTAMEEVYRMDQKRLEFGTIDFTILEISKNNYFTAKNIKTQRKYELFFRNKLLEFYVNSYDFDN